MTTYLTVRDLTEALSRIDPDAKVELEVRCCNTHAVEGKADQIESYTESEPLLDLHVHCSGARYVTLRGECA